MEDWDKLRHLGHERPTEALCQLVAGCMARVGASSVRIEGAGDALARRLTVPVSPDGDLVVAVWDAHKVLGAPQTKPRGILAIGPRPGTVGKLDQIPVRAYYDTMQMVGYVSVQRWSEPSRCYLDIQDGDLKAQAEALLGAAPYFSAQELFVPKADRTPATDDPVWHRWYRVQDQLELLSWTDRLRREGLRAVVPLEFAHLSALLRRQAQSRPPELAALYAALEQHPEVARGFAVWNGLAERGYTSLAPTMRDFMVGLSHENAGHPSARHVAEANLCMYYDGGSWPDTCAACLRVARKKCPCGGAAYCNRVCQRAHRSAHRAHCMLPPLNA